MKKYLRIANEGTLEVEALTLIGASSKRGDGSKIGMFGSGNKYALAYLLRNNHQVKIFSDGQPIEVETVGRKFRGNEFDVIKINGNETSITTDMGPKWQLWQAIRELYSNALDEGLVAFELTDVFLPQPGQTEIYIANGESIEKFMAEILDYFSDGKEAIHTDREGSIYKKHSSKVCVYRRGIRCYDSTEKSIYDYEFENISINESRVVDSNWQVFEQMWRMILNCPDSNVIRSVFDNLHKSDTMEYRSLNLSYVDLPGSVNKKAVLEAVANRPICPIDISGWVDDDILAESLLMPTSLYKWLLSNFPREVKSALKLSGDGGDEHIEINSDPLVDNTIRKVNEFFHECNYGIYGGIKVVRFTNKRKRSAYMNGEILLAEAIIEKGVQETAMEVMFQSIIARNKELNGETVTHYAIIGDYLNYMKRFNAINL